MDRQVELIFNSSAAAVNAYNIFKIGKFAPDHQDPGFRMSQMSLNAHCISFNCKITDLNSILGKLISDELGNLSVISDLIQVQIEILFDF
ncbi:MAG: hypothetical protein V7K89_35500 [Nostoc sp.]|uniref:hypothetical protein n=1 Tax=Nostoc sp. TaxID=1180 RepID=UPI002FFCC75F